MRRATFVGAVRLFGRMLIGLAVLGAVMACLVLVAWAARPEVDCPPHEVCDESGLLLPLILEFVLPAFGLVGVLGWLLIWLSRKKSRVE